MHLEWGAAGMREGGRLADVVVVVDVLSFSTAVAAAWAAGVEVYPHRSTDEYAAKVAARLGAHLAGERREVVPTPAALAGLARLGSGQRVVLPSPRAAGLCLDAAAAGATVVAGSLRNASAVGDWLRARQRRVVVVAVGDQWRDGAERMALEDLLGAGAIFDRLPADALSAEARVAVGAYRESRGDLTEILHSCTSGRELAARGFGDSATWAADVDASPVVPILVEGAFRPS